MIKLAACCLWMIAATLGAVYAGAGWKSASGKKVAVAAHGRLEQKKTEPISVPMIADGAVAGYVVAQFTYVVDADVAKEISLPADAFITDEAFRRLYAERVDFARLDRYDLTGFTRALIAQVNARLGRDIIKDILVEQFNYVPKAEISK